MTGNIFILHKTLMQTCRLAPMIGSAFGAHLPTSADWLIQNKNRWNSADERRRSGLRLVHTYRRMPILSRQVCIEHKKRSHIVHTCAHSKTTALPAISEHITLVRRSTHISSHKSPCIGMGDLTSAMIANYSSG